MLAFWENWTGTRFEGSGAYALDGALAPVEIDVDAKVGRYAEPNVWFDSDPLKVTFTLSFPLGRAPRNSICISASRKVGFSGVDLHMMFPTFKAAVS